MALLTKKEFAGLCDIATKNLATYILRKKVVAREDGLIDTADEKNKAFLQKYAKAKTEAAPQITIPEPSKEEEGTIQVNLGDGGQLVLDLKNIPQYKDSERLLKYLDTLKRQREVEKLELENAKKKGEVIPSELIQPLFMQHNQSLITEYKNATDEIVRTIKKKKDLNANEEAEIKGQLVQIVNTAMEKATTMTIKGLDNIINDFKDKRGRGEKI